VVERITGQIYQKTPMDARRQAASGYDVEELGLGFVHFAGGVTLDLIEAWAIQLDSFEGSSLAGSLGGVRLKPFGYFHTLADLDLNSTADLDAWLYRAHTVHGQGDEYDGAEQHFVAAVQGRVPLLPSADLALNTMLICEGIYLASALGREVAAEEVKERSVAIEPE
jgi:predicted dehydrogenase